MPKYQTQNGELVSTDEYQDTTFSCYVPSAQLDNPYATFQLHLDFFLHQEATPTQKAELALAKARLLELKPQLKINDRQLQSLPSIPLPLHEAEHKSSKMFGNGKSSSALVVQVIEARNLAGVDWDGLSNPYVTLVFADQSRTLPVLKKNLNPWWNARAVFVGPTLKDLLSMPANTRPKLKVAVLSKNLISSDDFLGGLILPHLHRLGMCCGCCLIDGCVWYE